MHHIYIYYRVERPEEARAAAGKILAGIQAKCGITGALLQRADDPATWMETYEGIEDLEGFTKALAAAEQSAGIAACLKPGTKRMCEHFVPVAQVRRD